jgi:hypothetical protein
MFHQIIHPKKKEDLIVQLPEEFLGKEIEVEANEINGKDSSKGKSREEILKEVFERWDSMKVNTKGFKFNRDEANER